MTSRTDEKPARMPSRSNQEGSSDNVVQLTPKLRARKTAPTQVGERPVSDQPVSDQRAERPVDGGGDDPGPSAA